MRWSLEVPIVMLLSMSSELIEMMLLSEVIVMYIGIGSGTNSGSNGWIQWKMHRSGPILTVWRVVVWSAIIRRGISGMEYIGNIRCIDLIVLNVSIGWNRRH